MFASCALCEGAGEGRMELDFGRCQQGHQIVSCQLGHHRQRPRVVTRPKKVRHGVVAYLIRPALDCCVVGVGVCVAFVVSGAFVFLRDFGVMQCFGNDLSSSLPVGRGIEAVIARIIYLLWFGSGT